MSVKNEYVWLWLLTCLLTFLFERLWIPFLLKKKAGQAILEIGPAWHMKKSGTPTPGGVAFIAAAVLCAGGFMIFCAAEKGEVAGKLPLLLLYALLCGGIGLADDLCKLSRGKNQGLTAPQKYALQLLASAIFLAIGRINGSITPTLSLPGSDGEIVLGIFYYPLALLFLTGVMNALNLTDGLDGLLAGTVAVLGVGFFALGSRGADGIFSFAGALLLGVSLGFLPYNLHPAKTFMGDTGSLFLGGLVAGAGILSGRPDTVFLAGGIYVTEAASVILQVVYFKLSHGKRLFRMAPLHHHFEKCGQSENRIVLLFSVLTAAFTLLAVLLY